MNNHEVHDRKSFVEYLAQLRAELDSHDLADGWENADLGRFLEAMQAWATDWPNAANSNPWQHAADLLAAAKIYE